MVFQELNAYEGSCAYWSDSNCKGQISQCFMRPLWNSAAWSGQVKLLEKLNLHGLSLSSSARHVMEHFSIAHILSKFRRIVKALVLLSMLRRRNYKSWGYRVLRALWFCHLQRCHWFFMLWASSCRNMGLLGKSRSWLQRSDPDTFHHLSSQTHGLAPEPAIFSEQIFRNRCCSKVLEAFELFFTTKIFLCLTIDGVFFAQRVTSGFGMEFRIWKAGKRKKTSIWIWTLGHFTQELHLLINSLTTI